MINVKGLHFVTNTAITFNNREPVEIQYRDPVQISVYILIWDASDVLVMKYCIVQFLVGQNFDGSASNPSKIFPFSIFQ